MHRCVRTQVQSGLTGGRNKGEVRGAVTSVDSVDSVVLQATNTEYGGQEIALTNVVFVHGSIDPWHAMGITNSSSPSAPAIYIEGTAHCANMYPASDSDPPQLTEARTQIGQLIKQWVGQ